MAENDRIARLAKQIDSEIRKEQRLLMTEAEALALRRKGAADLHAICAGFAASVNQHLSLPALELTPSEYAPENFRESGMNLIQLNAQGRIIQIAFGATRETLSTEKFLIPYILEGEVRAFNQEMLQRVQIRSQSLFYCLEDNQNVWRYIEWLNGRTGVFGRDQLVSLLERLV